MLVLSTNTICPLREPPLYFRNKQYAPLGITLFMDSPMTWQTNKSALGRTPSGRQPSTAQLTELQIYFSLVSG